MSFSKVTYDTRRAEGIAQEQLEKQMKLSEINKKGKVRRSRIYYFKQLRGKKARIKEK